MRGGVQSQSRFGQSLGAGINGGHAGGGSLRHANDGADVGFVLFSKSDVSEGTRFRFNHSRGNGLVWLLTPSLRLCDFFGCPWLQPHTVGEPIAFAWPSIAHLPIAGFDGGLRRHACGDRGRDLAVW